MGEQLQLICNIIILVGAVAGAILTIMSLCGKPIDIFKKQRKKTEDTKTTEFVNKVSDKVISELEKTLKQISDQNKEQNKSIIKLTNSMQDSIGAELANFYEIRKDDAVISNSEHVALKDLYRAYKRVHGNHHGDWLWEKMITWTVLDDKGKKIENPDWDWKKDDDDLE